jgi:hypothetical protein
MGAGTVCVVSPPFCVCRHPFPLLFYRSVSSLFVAFWVVMFVASRSASFHLQLSAMNVSARTTMKGAANCDKHCELQNSVNQ